MDRWQLSKEKRMNKWKSNFKAMRNRIKDRVRVAACSSAVYGSLRQGHMPSLNSATALRATATGLAVARVFKGNVILARLVHSKTKQELANKMTNFFTYFPSLRAMVSTSAVSAGGAAAAFAEPAYNDNVNARLALSTSRIQPLDSNYDSGCEHGMDMALSKLNQGDWVHIFPEGSRSRDGGRTIGRAKRGVGRLVVDAEKMPLVVPFVHTGMQEVMPIGSQFPHVSKKVTVLIGDPIKVDDLFMASSEEGLSKGLLYDTISLRVGERLQELKKELDELVLQQSLQIEKAHHAQVIERLNGHLQFIDWEAYDLLSHELLTEGEAHVSCLKQESTVDSMEPASKYCVNSESSHTMLIHQQAEGFENADKCYAGANDPSLHGGIVSRLQGFMDPSVLMGFAARGLVMNGKWKLDESITFRTWRYKVFNDI